MVKYIYKEGLSICSILISVICFMIGELQFVDSNQKPPGILSFLHTDFYNNYIIPNKFGIVCSIAVIFCIFQWHYYRTQQNDQKIWLNKFLEHLTNQHLAGGTYDTRITIFRKKKGRTLLIPLWWKKISTKERRYKKLPKWNRDYLTIYLRYSSIEPTKSYTYFEINESQSSKDESIVSECFRTGKTITRRTSSIKHIALTDKKEDLGEPNLALIKKYMSEMGLERYETLLKINVPSNSIMALPIQHEGKRWGVMVFQGKSMIFNIRLRLWPGNRG